MSTVANINYAANTLQKWTICLLLATEASACSAERGFRGGAYRGVSFYFLLFWCRVSERLNEMGIFRGCMWTFAFECRVTYALLLYVSSLSHTLTHTHACALTHTHIESCHLNTKQATFLSSPTTTVPSGRYGRNCPFLLHSLLVIPTCW